jgi:hypothetical protein
VRQCVSFTICHTDSLTHSPTKMALTPMLIRECYMRALEVFHERHVSLEANEDDIDETAIDEMRGPLITHLQLYEHTLQHPHPHPSLSKSIDNLIKGFSYLDIIKNNREKASKCFHQAQDEAHHCFRDLHVYEHQCLATRIRILSAIIR